MTSLEFRAVMALPGIRYPKDIWHQARAKTLYRSLHSDPLWSLSEHEANDLWFLIWRYRRQIADTELIARAGEVVNGTRLAEW